MTLAVAAPAPVFSTEIARLNKAIDRILSQGHYGDEVPRRIHTQDVDDGHGLGGPAFAPEFIRYLQLDRDDTYRAFRTSSNRAHRNRLQRALRNLRAISPQEYDAVYLIVARDMTWAEARARINTGRAERGQRWYTRQQFLILTILGFDILAEMF